MVYVTFFPSFSLLIFDKIRKLLLRLRQRRKPFLKHMVPSYRRWFLKRKQNLMLKRGDSNQMYTEKSQEKEDFVEVTSQDQESESTEATPNP